MAATDLFDKPLLERIQDLLEKQPQGFDVTFAVGPNKELVRGLQIILKAASPALQKEFEEKWETAVVKDGEGIPLPEYDAESFRIFVKLTSLDTWTLEALQKLNLPPNQLLTLLSISRRFELKRAVNSLQILAIEFMQSFSTFKDTGDFLGISRADLQVILASDDLGLKETEVFKCALRWAENNCQQRNVEPSVDNLRHALRGCLSEIRFPTMTVTDFTSAMEMKDLLTEKEAFEVYKYIGLDDAKKLNYDLTKLAFKTHPRKIPFKKIEEPGLSRTLNESQLKSETESWILDSAVPTMPMPTASTMPYVPLQPNPTPTALQMPYGCFSLSLTQGFQVVQNPPFLCNGRTKENLIEVKQKVVVYALGFLGPIDADAFYDVTVEFEREITHKRNWSSGEFEKRIFAKKGETFYFILDEPVTLRPDTNNSWDEGCYSIFYSLKGPNTPAIQRKFHAKKTLNESGYRFVLEWQSKQLSEIRFKKN